jgi:hypothetical protein
LLDEQDPNFSSVTQELVREAERWEDRPLLAFLKAAQEDRASSRIIRPPVAPAGSRNTPKA